MGKKVRNLTAQGQAVRGLLTGILAPRLAADAALKPGDIDKLLKGVALGKYTPQIPLIVADAKAKFGGHLVKDASLDDLPEILEALKAAGGDWMNALTRLIDDAALRSKYARNNCAWIKEYGTIESTADAWRAAILG